MQHREHAAQATANSVIASANRLMELRQLWFSSSRIAEISVPAWPIPIHQTKFVIAKAPGDRDVVRPRCRRPCRADTDHAMQEQQQQR